MPTLNDGKEEIDMEDEMIVSYGEAVKSMGDGRVAGYLIRFTTDQDPDLEGDFFTKDTDYGMHRDGEVYYNHGIDVKLRKRVIGTAKAKIDEFGVWAEAQLNMRDKYEEFVYKLAKMGKLGWSSATASHLIERQKKDNATWIAKWPIGLDYTLTTFPAEPRNTVVSLKSWKPAEDFTVTLAERMSMLSDELKTVTSDLRGLVDGIDKPLSNIKREELKELLELCSELDAVRSELSDVLHTAPPERLVGPRLIGYQLAQARQRLTAKHILQE